MFGAEGPAQLIDRHLPPVALVEDVFLRHGDRADGVCADVREDAGQVRHTSKAARREGVGDFDLGMRSAFDAPEPLVSQGSRPTTTVAPQALWLMNSPPVRSWASLFAKRLGPSNAHSLTECVNQAYSLALNRPPAKHEAADSLTFIHEQLARYEAEKKPDARELALTDFAQVVLNLNEFIYVE